MTIGDVCVVVLEMERSPRRDCSTCLDMPSCWLNHREGFALTATKECWKNRPAPYYIKEPTLLTRRTMTRKSYRTIPTAELVRMWEEAKEKVRGGDVSLADELYRMRKELSRRAGDTPTIDAGVDFAKEFTTD